MTRQTETKKAFDASAQKAEAYTFDYDCEVEQFYQDHPERKDEVFFLEVDGLKVRMVRPDSFGDRDQKMRAYNGHAAFPYLLADFVIKGTAGRMLPLEGKKIVMLRKNAKAAPHRSFPRLWAGKGSDRSQFLIEVYKAFVLDHELGHALCTGAQVSSNPSECRADGYASIRHVQRFSSVEFIQQRLEDRTAFLFADPANNGLHFTAPVMRAVINDALKFGFADVSVRDVPALAEIYADMYAPNTDLMAGARALFMNGDLDNNKLAEFVALVNKQDKKNPAGAWARSAVQIFLDDRLRVEKENPVPFNGPWAKLRVDFAAACVRNSAPANNNVVQKRKLKR